MKTLFLIFFLVMGLFANNLFVFETACKVKTSQKVVAEKQNLDKLETPTPAPSPAQVQWKPSEYFGIIPGQSTYKDVKKILGKPRSEGPDPESEMENDAGQDTEFNTLLQYSNGVEVIIGSDTKIVKTIGTSYSEMNKQDAIVKFGTEYFEVEGSHSACVTEEQKRGSSEKKEMDYPILLVYPEKGMTISIAKDNSVIGIWFLYKCEN